MKALSDEQVKGALDSLLESDLALAEAVVEAQRASANYEAAAMRLKEANAKRQAAIDDRMRDANGD